MEAYNPSVMGADRGMQEAGGCHLTAGGVHSGWKCCQAERKDKGCKHLEGPLACCYVGSRSTRVCCQGGEGGGESGAVKYSLHLRLIVC